MMQLSSVVLAVEIVTSIHKLAWEIGKVKLPLLLFFDKMLLLLLFSPRKRHKSHWSEGEPTSRRSMTCLRSPTKLPLSTFRCPLHFYATLLYLQIKGIITDL